ncbi:O-antigen translocase [uncultured Muribaculum sp.]|uniref:O-antigen translocase n=5 Tax=uncultured Muribaculum sp. TaxID=1918613 RepID=UPI000F49E1EE|nr:O-antigen translocase [uncultured Muribaculum sp.]ROT12191.1 O-antigen translocase [Muribaculaceae bacterium Isolate-102 (HZI)]
MAGLVAKAKSFISRVLKADIVKVFSLTSISTLVKMCTGLVSVKIVASIIGPAGVALVGQLNNFSTIALSLATGGINSGITKYIAEYKSDASKVKQYLATAFRITVVCSLLVGLVLLLLCKQLSSLIMMTPQYWYVFAIFGITITFYGLNNMLVSVVNGYKQFNKYVKVNVVSSIFGVAFTVALVLALGLPGALISAVTFQSLMIFVSVLMLRKLEWLRKDWLVGKFKRTIASQYFRYALMTLLSAFLVPISQMLLRGYVISEISITEAGWWEGMNRISNMYLMVITSSFSVYYLPRLSEISDRIELRHEIFKCYKVIVPLLLAGFTVIYFLRFFIVKLLFTHEFMPMTQLFIWQMAGDFFKICSWLLAFLMVAKSMTKAYISTEIIFTLSYILLGYTFIRLDGIVGLCQAYLTNYVLYLVVLTFMFRKLLFR